MNLLERRVGVATDPLTIEYMRDELCLRFERVSKQSKDGGILDINDEEEHALYAGTQFKGKCYVCGKIGHKGANCRDRIQPFRAGGRNYGGRFGGRGGRGNNGGRGGYSFKGNCHYCQKPGHKSSDCRQRKADQNPRENAEIVLMAEDGGGLGRCIHCGDFGPFGNFWYECEDSGFIYASLEGYDEETDGRGNYWEEKEDADEESSDSSALSIKDEHGNIQVLEKIKKKYYSFEPPTREQIEGNEFVVLTTADNSPEYANRLKSHSTGNTDNGLFDLLIIVGLEYHREWQEDGLEVLDNAKQRLRQ